MIRSSILILAKNEEQNIGSCLESVFAQGDIFSSEVIVVDSGSTDRTVEIASRYPVKLFHIAPEEFHHARTRNFAAGLAQGDFLVYLAADAFPSTADWLGALVQNLEDPSVGAVYGRQLAKPGCSVERQDVFDAIYGSERLVKEPSTRAQLGYRYYHMSTVNAAIRRDVWKQTGFPGDFKVFEDLGIAKKILDGGWKIVYEPKAAVYHSHSHTMVGLFKRYFDIGFTLNRLGVWNETTRSSMLNDAKKMFGKKIKRIDSQQGRRSVGVSVGQDIAKSAGMILGLNERYLPLVVKRRLSAFRVYDQGR